MNHYFSLFWLSLFYHILIKAIIYNFTCMYLNQIQFFMKCFSLAFFVNRNKVNVDLSMI